MKRAAPYRHASLTGLMIAGVFAGSALLPVQASDAPEDFTRWPVLVNPFASTSGGGVIIDQYRPVVEGKLCRTDFTVLIPGPDAKPLANAVEFDAVPVAGGVLCTNGRWRAKDGSASGTTPFRVFIRDGVVRRPPA